MICSTKRVTVEVKSYAGRHKMANATTNNRLRSWSWVRFMFLLALYWRAKDHGVAAQDPVTTEAPAAVTSESPSAPDGSCPGSKPGQYPITINTYGACAGSGSGTGSGDQAERLDDLRDAVSDLRDQVNRLTSRLTFLEDQVQGGSGGGGGTPPVGGGGNQPVFRGQYTDCTDIYEGGNTTDGVYAVWPRQSPNWFYVLCEFAFDGNWTVVQERNNALVDFQRGWLEYRTGFGRLQPGHNFWLGLDPIYYITTSGPQYELLVDLRDWTGARRFARYQYFALGPLADNYRLYVFMYTPDSTAGDALGFYHNYVPFSTFDDDNDYAAQNCAQDHGGGWWYRDCDNANLNGIYQPNPILLGPTDNGIEWDNFRPMYSLQHVRMSIKKRFPNFGLERPIP